MNIREAWELVKQEIPRWEFLCVAIEEIGVPRDMKVKMKHEVLKYRGYYSRKRLRRGYAIGDVRFPLTPRGRQARIAFCNRMIRESQ